MFEIIETLYGFYLPSVKHFFLSVEKFFSLISIVFVVLELRRLERKTLLCYVVHAMNQITNKFKVLKMKMFD